MREQKQQFGRDWENKRRDCERTKNADRERTGEKKSSSGEIGRTKRAVRVRLREKEQIGRDWENKQSSSGEIGRKKRAVRERL